MVERKETGREEEIRRWEMLKWCEMLQLNMSAEFRAPSTSVDLLPEAKHNL